MKNRKWKREGIIMKQINEKLGKRKENGAWILSVEGTKKVLCKGQVAEMRKGVGRHVGMTE